MRFRFGDCSLDTSSRELRRAGAPVHITGKAFRVLEVLIENHPAALSKEQLHDLVWPGIFVSEANLTSLIAELRKAIGDDARSPTTIRTVYGFGYAFSVLAGTEDAVPARKPRAGRCQLLWGRKKIVLVEGENILGRGPESIEWIDRDTVSRRHARIVIAGEMATIEDLASKNGTTVEGRPLCAVEALADGDRIKLGSVPLTFRVLLEPGSTATTGLRDRRGSP